MSSLPSQALDAQVELIDFYATEMGSVYADAVVDAIIKDTDRLKGWGARLHRLALKVSDTYAVSSDIITILEAAAPSVPEYSLHATDLPSPFGFVFLERPFLCGDGFGKPLVVKAFSWSMVSRASHGTEDLVIHHNDHDMMDVNLDDPNTGLIMILWTDPTDPRDHLHDQFDTTHLLLVKEYNASPPYNLWSMIGGLWTMGQPPRGPWDKFMMAFFSFIADEWIDSSPMRADRPALRRAGRAKFSKADDPIRVVRLRRRHEHNGESYDGPRMRYLDHQGIVRGHWRNQWYPSINDHRPKWIHQFVKGPEGAPLKVNTTIFNVDR